MRVSQLPYPSSKQRLLMATNLLSGFKTGTYKILLGLSKGVSGVVTEPYYGAKKKGFKGGSIGLGKGLGGLIYRPIRGGLEFVAYPLAGAVNTPAYLRRRIKQKKKEDDANFNKIFGYDSGVCGFENELDEITCDQLWIDSS